MIYLFIYLAIIFNRILVFGKDYEFCIVYIF